MSKQIMLFTLNQLQVTVSQIGSQIYKVSMKNLSFVIFTKIGKFIFLQSIYLCIYDFTMGVWIGNNR